MGAKDYSVSSVFGAAVAVVLLLFVGKSIYNVFFHPLRHFPGPLFLRASRLGYINSLVRGRLALDVHHWHEKYGPVIRIAPDELAFIKPEAWKDIYGHRTGANAGHEEMAKSDVFYSSLFGKPSLLGESRENHQMIRRHLAHGFSEKAMRLQEPLVMGYVELLIRRLHEHCFAAGNGVGEYKDDEKAQTTQKFQPLDMTAWYNWTTFDIIGDLAFGEPFDSLKDAKEHPWVSALTNTIVTVGVFIGARMMHVGLLFAVFVGLAAPGRIKVLKMGEEKVKRRIALGTERPDFLQGLLIKDDKGELIFDEDRLMSNANLLMLGGSETTATLLAGATYLLLKTPEALKRLTAEVRSSFSSDSEITLHSVSRLTYMLACLDEALRCYPPVPFGMPRIVPKGGGTIAGHFVPAGTSVACWQWAMNYSTRNWDEPTAYRPERFLEGYHNDKDHFEALQPFSLGPRNCIGRNLAYAEMRLILARILYNFDIEMVDPNFDWMKHHAVYVLWGKPELNVYLKPVQA